MFCFKQSLFPGRTARTLHWRLTAGNVETKTAKRMKQPLPQIIACKVLTSCVSKTIKINKKGYWVWNHNPDKS